MLISIVRIFVAVVTVVMLFATLKCWSEFSSLELPQNGAVHVPTLSTGQVPFEYNEITDDIVGTTDVSLMLAEDTADIIIGRRVKIGTREIDKAYVVYLKPLHTKWLKAEQDITPYYLEQSLVSWAVEYDGKHNTLVYVPQKDPIVPVVMTIVSVFCIALSYIFIWDMLKKVLRIRQMMEFILT